MMTGRGQLIFLLAILALGQSCGQRSFGGDFQRGIGAKFFSQTTDDGGINGGIKDTIKQLETQHGLSFDDSIPVNFLPADLPNRESYEGKVGVCNVYGNGDREILLVKSYWNAIGPCMKKALLIHEYGHCFRNLPHAQDNGLIMNSRLPAQCEDKNIQAYVTEVQGGSSSSGQGSMAARAHDGHDGNCSH